MISEGESQCGWCSTLITPWPVASLLRFGRVRACFFEFADLEATWRLGLAAGRGGGEAAGVRGDEACCRGARHVWVYACGLRPKRELGRRADSQGVTPVLPLGARLVADHSRGVHEHCDMRQRPSGLGAR